MRSVGLKVFSCQYEAITVLFNLLYGDLIRRRLCRVIFSQELLFSVRQNRQKWDQISWSASNLLPYMHAGLLAFVFWAWLFCSQTCQPVQDPSAGALSSLLRVVRAPLGSPGVRSFLCTYLSCRCPVSRRAQPAPFECFESAPWFNVGFSVAILLYMRGRSYKCLRRRYCTQKYPLLLKSSGLLSM